jgi:hypothetical protein
MQSTTCLHDGVANAILRLPCIRGTQEADVTGLIDHEEVLDPVALLLAAVVVLLVLRIDGAVDQSLSAIMPKRGAVDLPSVACVANIAANSAAVRAGSSSWSAKA